MVREFGSAAQTIAASEKRLLLATSGDAAAVAVISDFRADLDHILRSRVDRRPILSVWGDLLDYLRFDMAYGHTEQVRVLHLSLKNRLIRDEIVGEGTIDEAPLYVREIIARALELGSARLILVHNHPSSDAKPSRADREITRRLSEAGRLMGVSLLDHVIVAASGTMSCRVTGVLP